MADKISGRQMVATLWLALLAVAVGALPKLAVATAGRAGVLIPLAVAPALWAMGVLLCRLGGLQCAVETALGRAVGRGVLLLYSIWGGLLIAVRLDEVGGRLSQMGARWLVIVVVAVLVGWMAWGKRGAFGRTVEVFFAIIAVTLALVVLLSLKRVEWTHLLPLWWSDVAAAVGGLAPTLGLFGGVILLAVLLDEVEWTAAAGRSWFFWTCGGCAMLTVVLATVVGTFGGTLTLRLDEPFLSLAKSIGVDGMFQRVEDIVAGLWLLCDLALMGAILRAVTHLVCRSICPSGRDGAVSGAILTLATLLALAGFGGGGWLIWSGLWLGWIVPTLTIIIVYLRRRGKSTR